MYAKSERLEEIHIKRIYIFLKNVYKIEINILLEDMLRESLSVKLP